MRFSAYVLAVAGLVLVNLGPAFGQDRDRRLRDLLTLVMVEQSIELCDFPISEEAMATLVEAVGFYQDRLAMDDAELETLYERSAEQLAGREADYCDPQGAWRKLFDQTVRRLGRR